MSELLKIGQLAKASGATIDTIRFYEDKGLLSPKSRSESGYRFYDDDALNILLFIQTAKELGFTLSEIKEFLEIQISKKGKCSLTQLKIDEKITDIDKKISDLKNIKKALKNVSVKCNTTSMEDSCHFLELLGGKIDGK